MLSIWKSYHEAGLSQALCMRPADIELMLESLYMSVWSDIIKFSMVNSEFRGQTHWSLSQLVGSFVNR